MPAAYPTCTSPRTKKVILSLMRAGFQRDVRFVLIGGSLAETAQTPPLRPPPTSALIGITLAEIAEIAGKQKWVHGTPTQPPCGTFGGQ
jgi:hypothetical protein